MTLKDDGKCCENGDNCANCGCGGGHGHHGDKLPCCMEHKMTKEHLEAKKKMLEEKLEWVNEQLSDKK